MNFSFRHASFLQNLAREEVFARGYIIVLCAVQSLRGPTYQFLPSAVKMPFPRSGKKLFLLRAPNSKSLNWVAKRAWMFFGSVVTNEGSPRKFCSQVETPISFAIAIISAGTTCSRSALITRHTMSAPSGHLYGRHGGDLQPSCAAR